MSSKIRKTNRKLFREAEGFLELATLFDDRFPLEQNQKTVLATRCVDTLNQIRQAGTRQARVLYLKGQALRLAEDHDRALEALEQACEMDSSNIHIFLAMAWCFKRKNQVGLAVEAMQRALAIDRSSGIVHYNMACYLSLLQQSEMALVHLSKAIEIDSSFRELAIDEPDFDPIRNDPGFREKTVSAQS